MDVIYKLLLGPILLAQGWRVHRRAGFLAEPPGARQGATGTGPLLRVLILGDSSAAGVGASHQDRALAGQLVQRLAAHYRVEWALIAASGLDAAGIHALLLAQTAQAYDIAVLCCGVNDVTGGAPARASLVSVRMLIEVLRERHQVQRILMAPVPPMHRFPALPHPLRWYLGRRARRLDQALQAAVPGWPGVERIDHGIDVTPATMAADGFHPSEMGYALWAEALTQRLIP